MATQFDLDPKTTPMACMVHDFYATRASDAATSDDYFKALVETLQQTIVAIGVLEMQINTDMARPGYGPTSAIDPAGRFEIPSREIPDELRSPVSVRVDAIERRLHEAGL